MYDQAKQKTHPSLKLDTTNTSSSKFWYLIVTLCYQNLHKDNILIIQNKSINTGLFYLYGINPYQYLKLHSEYLSLQQQQDWHRPKISRGSLGNKIFFPKCKEVTELYMGHTGLW